MTGIETIIKDINKKTAFIKKEAKKMEIQITAFKQVVAKQIAEYNTALNGFKTALIEFSKKTDERFKKLERKPCMAIETIFDEEQINKLLSLIK